MSEQGSFHRYGLRRRKGKDDNIVKGGMEGMGLDMPADIFSELSAKDGRLTEQPHNQGSVLLNQLP